MVQWDDGADDEAGEAAAFGLALYPPAAVAERLRRDLAERGLRSPSHFHLTLKYAFLPNRALDQHWERLEQFIAAQPPLRLRSCGMLASAETYCHLLLIEPEPELMQLHARVMEILDGCGAPLSAVTARFEGRGYTPHITVGYGASASEFEIHEAMLAEYEPSIHFVARSVERVDRARLHGADGWSRTIARSFPFGTASALPAHI